MLTERLPSVVDAGHNHCLVLTSAHVQVVKEEEEEEATSVIWRLLLVKEEEG